MDTTPPTTPDPRNRRIALAAVFALSLAFGAWGLWRVVAPTSTDVRAQLADSEAARKQLQADYEELQQRVATLGRSDQISREANRDLHEVVGEIVAKTAPSRPVSSGE